MFVVFIFLLVFLLGLVLVLVVTLAVEIIARVDPVAVHVDGLAEVRDVARVLLPTHLLAWSQSLGFRV